MDSNTAARGRSRLMFPLILTAAFALPVHADQAVAKELKLLEGAWEPVSLVQDGIKRESLQEGTVRLIVRGGFFKLTWGDRELGRGRLMVDPAAKPRALDFFPTEQVVLIPEWKVAGRPCIYELKGDELRICFAQLDQPRPSSFDAEADKRLCVMTYRRVKTKE
jgi:uncharacterized protein (TIGR03067 family)